jgi:hypothetical protein
VLVGAFFITIISLVNPYLQFFLDSWWIAGGGSLLAGPVTALVLLVLANGIVVKRWPRRALTRAEMLTVYGMGMVSLGFLGVGGLPYLVSSVTYAFYMASPANNWEHMILPHIPSWLSPRTLQASYWFWEGLPEGVGVPWRAWLSPGVWWALFTAALFGGMYALGALLSRDWVEHQRLTYPLVDIPLAIAGDADQPTLAASILRNRLLWLGAAVPAVVEALLFLSRYYPDVPASELAKIHIGKAYLGTALPWSTLGTAHFGCTPPILGVMCLIPSEVSLSIWLFYALYRLQLIAWGAFGVAPEGGQGELQPQTMIGYAEAGGYLALTAVLLYQSRQAIKLAVRSLFRRAEEADPYEPLSRRSLVALFLLSNGFILWFAIRANMDLWAVAAIMGFFYAFAIAASRLVAAGGVMMVHISAQPWWCVVRLIGGRMFTPATHALLAYWNGCYMSDTYNLPMPQMMNAFRLARSERIAGRRFSLAAGIAIALVLAVGIPAMLRMIYDKGGTSLPDWPFSMWPRFIFGGLETNLRAPEEANNWLRGSYLAGALAMLGLSWLHLNLATWPLSPLGFVIASTWATDNYLWGAALVGWVVVTIVKRTGGLRLYRRLRPLFLGLVIGQVLSDGLFGLLKTLFDYQRLLS